MEYSGYTMIRGCGCRAGFCGACATIYNFKNDPQLRYDLACQKTVEQDMVIVQVPFFPSVKSIYDLDKIQADGDTVLKLYPDIVKCFGCNTCTKTCPQELEVMWFMSDALRGDIAAAADKSFDCLMCGLCAARCPQGLVPYNVAILCRRLYGHNLASVSQHLLDRIAEIEAGEFDSELNKLIKANQKELSRLYAERDIESALEQAWE
jgi:heterodisulfide reductase subunit C